MQPLKRVYVTQARKEFCAPVNTLKELSGSIKVGQHFG